jgi:hypothetical protein
MQLFSRNKILLVLFILLLIIIILGFLWQKRNSIKLVDLSSPLPGPFSQNNQLGQVSFNNLKSKINNLKLEEIKNYFKIEFEKEILETKLEVKKLSFNFSKIWNSFSEKLFEKYEIKQKISDFFSKIILEAKNLFK